MSHSHLALAALISLSCSLLAQDTAKAEVWYADFDKAVLAAKEAKKDLLVDFTGSDWCGWCIKLHEEVFQHASFLEGAQKQYVLVALDFPQDDAIKAKVPNPARNEELQQKYGIQGFPTILLMNPEGEVYAKASYQPGGPEKYLTYIEAEAKKGKDALASVSTFSGELAKAADAAAKKVVIEKAIEALGKAGGDSVAAPALAKVVKEALTLDADNKMGLKAQALKAILAAGQGDEAVVGMAKELDPKNENGLFERYVESVFGRVNDEDTCKAAIKALEELDGLGGAKDKELGVRLLSNAAMWCQGPLQDSANAKKWAQKAKDLKPENERMLKMLEEILGS